MEQIKFKENWISVTKELPPISTDKQKYSVMIYCCIGITTGYYWGQTKESDPCKGWCIMGVTHWSPMIEAPEN